MTPPDTDDHLRIILEHINAMGNINSNSLTIMGMLIPMHQVHPEMKMVIAIFVEMKMIKT